MSKVGSLERIKSDINKDLQKKTTTTTLSLEKDFM